MTTYGIGFVRHSKKEMIHCEFCGVEIEKWPPNRKYCSGCSTANTRKKTREYHQRERDRKTAEREAPNG